MATGEIGHQIFIAYVVIFAVFLMLGLFLHGVFFIPAASMAGFVVYVILQG